MPGLVACGRRWDIGSDDLVFPAFAEIQVRGAWLIAIAVMFSIHRDILPMCSNGHLLRIYYIGMLVLLSLHIITDIAILRLSMRGTIMDDRPRRRMPLFLYVKIPLFCPEFAWTTLGTYWAFRESTCDLHVVWTVKGAVIVGWIVMVVLLIGLWIVFDPLGSHSSQHEDTEMDATAAAARLWETRCSVLCCCVRGDEESKNAFNEIAKMISNFFKGVDLVPTDIAAGLILVQVEQRKNLRAVRMVPITYLSSCSSTDVGVDSQLVGNQEEQAKMNERLTDAAATSSDEPVSATAVYIQPGELAPRVSNANLSSVGRVYPQPTDWMNIPAAAHYMRFAAASYGWPLFMYSNLFTGACQLCTECRCCACVKSSSHIVDDDCCGCNVAAILRMTDVHEEDIIYASFYNRVYEIPFFVALDHQHQTVVVAIRGTLSLRDALTDLTAHSECIELEEVGDGRAHKGILQAARYIKNTLNNMQLLETAFQRGQGYRLVITGHSLGAGAATLVSVLLRPQYPNLICYAYSPPGLVSLQLSRHTESFVCSVVVGQDLVPRLGVSSMEHLKGQVLQLIHDSNKPKYKLLASGCWYALFGVPRSEESQSLLRSRSSHRSYDDGTGSQQHLYVEQPLEEQNVSNSHQCDIIPLYVPGHVMYIEEASDTGLCCGTPSYVAGWARAEMFNEIIVSPKMVLHHLPDIVMKALDQLSEQHSVPHYIARPQRS